MRRNPGISLPYLIWIGPVEDAQTIAKAATALRSCVACSVHGCDHRFQCFYNFDGMGGFKMTRACTPWYSPSVCIDKHMPSFEGFLLAGYGRVH